MELYGFLNRIRKPRKHRIYQRQTNEMIKTSTCFFCKREQAHLVKSRESLKAATAFHSYATMTNHRRNFRRAVRSYEWMRRIMFGDKVSGESGRYANNAI